MTDDFEVAVEEGATIVRVGRALFGERPHDHGGGLHSHVADRRPGVRTCEEGAARLGRVEPLFGDRPTGSRRR